MPEETKSAVYERQLIVFNISDEEFGFDINDVREIIKLVDITKIPDIEDYFKGIINLRGNVIGVIDLAKKLHMQEKEVDDKTRIIVVEVGEDQVGLLVDEVSEVLR
ncbi:chemotaxis protein CheW, partial [Candidatus Woesearchaeota archaeon]